MELFHFPAAGPTPTRRRGFALRRLGTGALVLALAGGGASIASAQPMGPKGGSMDGPACGPHMAGHAPGGSFGGHGGAMLPDRLLDGVGASADQKTRVRDIFKAAQDDLRKQHDAARDLHGQMLALFTAPKIDAAAAEALRQKQLAQHDAASKRQLQAMLDAQAVLTPEQRLKLADRLKARQELFQRHQHEREQLDKPRS
jgi:Spy/CpxP family protein refolding chaperone